MKRKIKIAIYTLLISSSLIITAIPAMAEQKNNTVLIYNEDNQIQPRTDIKEWRYKVENGNLYKRLYNCSTGRWEGDWIFVCSGVEEL